MQAVLRFQPIERKGLKSVGMHNSRGYTDDNRPGHIDVSRSSLNRVLVGPEIKKISGAMAAAIEKIPMARKSSDAGKDIVMCEAILSASPEFFQLTGATEKWSRQSVEWLKKEFGEKLLSAVLHLDEQTPHIHAVIRVDEEKSRIHPVTKERMPAKRVLCYSDHFVDRKEVLTRARIDGRSHLDTKLGRFQTRYAEAVSSLGLERGRESARTKDKNLVHTKTQLEAEIQSLKIKKDEEIQNLSKVKVKVEETIKKMELEAIENGKSLYRREVEKVKRKIEDLFLCKNNAKQFFFSLRENQRKENIHRNTFLNKVNCYNNINVVEMKNG